MRLDELVRDIDVIETRGSLQEVEVESVGFDSRSVRPGSLYCCIRGGSSDGHDYAALAVAGGASALLCEYFVDSYVPQIRVANTRAAMARAAAEIYGHPSEKIKIVGITGTNGKTTTTYLLSSIFECHGWPTEIIGTLSGARTTPEAPVLQGLFTRFVAEGRKAVAMEVSSHALDQHRVDATRFAVAVFTNLSQDHLDYHDDMENYFEAKAKLFDIALSDRAVINIDDEAGKKLMERVSIPAVGYGIEQLRNLEITAKGSSFEWNGVEVRLQLGAGFNVSNALAAASTAQTLGIPPATIAEGLWKVSSVPGRFERVDADQPFSVIIDYAHTPDGLRKILEAGRELVKGTGSRLITVFGCGGDRDRGKRPLMGEVATRLSDLAVLTSDNPRSEDPLAIMAEAAAGVSRKEVLIQEPDRAAAISLAIKEARPGDVVIIAGKGHETGQEIAGKLFPFDDKDVARRAIESTSKVTK